MGAKDASDASKDAPIDPDVAMFAARTFERQAAEREAKQASRDARRREEEHQTLISTKDRAASEVKRLRSLEHTQPGEAAAAEEAYRQALADLIAFETGKAPAWAAASEAEPETPDPVDAAEDDEAGEAGDGADAVSDEA